MLSSGTLNLKFMKRNLAANTKPVISEPVEPSSNADVSASRPSVDRKGKQRETEFKVVCEDSLLSFPVLYGSSGAGYDGCTSTFAGRRSFGNFNSAVEQLGQPPKKPPTYSEPAPQASSSSRSHEPRPSNLTKPKRNSVKLSQDKPSSRSNSESKSGSKPHDAPSNSSQEIAPTPTGFQRPFQNTQIKSNPKKRATESQSYKEDDPATSSQLKKKRTSQSSGSENVKSRASKKNRTSSSSDDSDTVNREIERMFLECRESNANQ